MLRRRADGLPAERSGAKGAKSHGGINSTSSFSLRSLSRDTLPSLMADPRVSAPDDWSELLVRFVDAVLPDCVEDAIIRPDATSQLCTQSHEAIYPVWPTLVVFRLFLCF